MTKMASPDSYSSHQHISSSISIPNIFVTNPDSINMNGTIIQKWLICIYRIFIGHHKSWKGYITGSLAQSGQINFHSPRVFDFRSLDFKDSNSKFWRRWLLWPLWSFSKSPFLRFLNVTKIRNEEQETWFLAKTKLKVQNNPGNHLSDLIRSKKWTWDDLVNGPNYSRRKSSKSKLDLRIFPADSVCVNKLYAWFSVSWIQECQGINITEFLKKNFRSVRSVSTIYSITDQMSFGS